MAFPSDHAYPASLPDWLIEGHQLTAGERIAVTQFDQGEDRHREIRTFTPMLARVSTVLETQAQFDLFDEWYEGDIKSGSLRFDTKVAGLNGALVQWWVGQFVGPYRVEIPKIGVSIVTAELILLDGPYDAGFDPDTAGDTRIAPSLSARSIGDSLGTARFASAGLRGWSEGESELWAIQNNSLQGWSEGESELTGTLASVSFLLLPDGVSYLLLPDAVSRLALPE